MDLIAWNIKYPTEDSGKKSDSKNKRCEKHQPGVSAQDRNEKGYNCKPPDPSQIILGEGEREQSAGKNCCSKGVY